MNAKSLDDLALLVAAQQEFAKIRVSRETLQTRSRGNLELIKIDDQLLKDPIIFTIDQSWTTVTGDTVPAIYRIGGLPELLSLVELEDFDQFKRYLQSPCWDAPRHFMALWLAGKVIR